MAFLVATRAGARVVSWGCGPRFGEGGEAGRRGGGEERISLPERCCQFLVLATLSAPSCPHAPAPAVGEHRLFKAAAALANSILPSPSLPAVGEH